MKTLFFTLQRLYERFFKAVDFLQSPFLLAVRLDWGWQLGQSGWGQLHHLDKVTEFFTSLNLPAAGTMAVLISCLEVFGGIFLAIRLLSRLTALAPTVTMIMAYL